MDMSFKEKAAWISLFFTTLIFGNYFIKVLGLQGMEEDQARDVAISLLIQTTILSVLVEAVFHAMLAATNRKAAEMGADERDRAIELRANNQGYTVLAFGVVICLIRLIFIESGVQDEPLQSSLDLPMLTAHILLFSFILSEVVRFASQVWQYRRSA